MTDRQTRLHKLLLQDLAELKLSQIAECYREVLDEAARKNTSMLEVLANHPIEVGPQYLRLVDQVGMKFEPMQINLDYPVARFYAQVIKPEYGTSFLSIFALPESSEIGHLLYFLPDDQQLSVVLIP